MAFAAGGGVPVYLALNEGGYDPVIRQQAGIMVWAAVLISYLFGLAPRVPFGRRRRVAVGAALAFAAWTALSLLWTQSASATTDDLARIVDYIGVVVLVWSFLDAATWRWAAAGLTAAGVAICGLAVAARLFPFDFPDSRADLLFGGDRLTYPLGYWNGLGCWAAMTFAMLASWAAHHRDRLIRALCWRRRRWRCSAVYLTYSRGAAGGVVVAAISVVWLSRPRRAAVVQIAVALLSVVPVVAVAYSRPEHCGRNRGLGGSLGGALPCRRDGRVRARRMANLPGLHLVPGGIAQAGPARSPAFVALAVVVGALFAARARQGLPTGGGGPQASGPLTGVIPPDSARRRAGDDLVLGAGARSPRRPSMESARARSASGGRQTRRIAPTFATPTRSISRPWRRTGSSGRCCCSWLSAPWRAPGVGSLRTARRRSHLAACVGLVAAFCLFLVQAGVDWMWESPAVSVFALMAIAIAGSAGTPRARGPPA